MIRWLEKKRFNALTFTILIALEIYHFSSLSGSATGGGSPWIARVYHFIVFFLFAFFLLAFFKSKDKAKLKYLIPTLIISILYAISDELHQVFVPGRDGGLRDILTDTLGIFCSIIFYTYVDNKSKPVPS